MDSTKFSRRGAGRYVAAALAAGAAVAMLGTGPAAYAAPTPQVSLPVTAIALGSDWSGQAGFGSAAPGFYVETSLVGAGRGASAGGGSAGVYGRF